MQLVVILAAVLGVVIYSGELPQILQFPLPLTLGAIFTTIMLYALAKA